MKKPEFHPNRFVAPPERVRSIQERYVNYFPASGAIADLGCGEGIFLKLLKESGRNGTGVDMTPGFVKSIRAQGMHAVSMDIFQFLRKRKRSLDGAFASHIIEHFDAQKGLDLIHSVYDALRPGGVFAIITPTYEDILVSGERFWLDITHVRPYPLLLLHELFVHAGFVVIDEGQDKTTRIPLNITQPRGLARNLIGMIRFGKRYNLGDTFIVGKKP